MHDERERPAPGERQAGFTPGGGAHDEARDSRVASAPADAGAADDAGSTDASNDAPDAFESLVDDALEGLPPIFRDRLDTVAVVVEDEPTAYQLAAVGAPGLFGLYTGVPRTAWGASDAALPSKITIFRGPHVRVFRDPESLARGVTATVRHEVAHHFGISDARLEELGRQHGA
jgi:predicted Zn-dependent protease with MMP-like domain